MPPSRTLPAFKILWLLALTATLGCHAAPSHDHVTSERPAATSMPGTPTAAAATGSAPNSATPAPNGAKTANADPAGGCAAHDGSSCSAEERARAAATPAVPSGTQVGKYGAPLGNAPAENLASVLTEPSRFAGQPVRVEGHVRRACTAMGCWMELAESSAADAPACRVIMKDHAFFVPTTSAGSNARVEGSLAVRHIDPAQVAHMESEGASFPRKAADGSAEELRFVASGVELWRG